jgi:signal transduction histidine kinase
MKSEKIKVLYVDDEENNLLAFKASFRFDFNIKLANSPEEAFKILDEEEFQIILSDFRMPFMTGVEMFEKIRVNYPEPVRMLLTAYSDIESLIDAVNKGHIFRYIKKPWQEADIKTAIEEGYKFYLTRNILADKHKELIAAYKDLDRFVYSVSHDLRSPLMGILAIAQLIEKEQNLKEIHTLIYYVQKNVGKLDEFIKNLLEYYRVKRGELTLRPIRFQKIIDDLSAMYVADTLIQRIKLDVKVEQSGEFVSDPMVIMVVLQNLLSNAIKYQKENGVDRFVKLNADIRNNMAVIRVEDNGIGIEAEYQDKVFDMFFRASSQGLGSGIGLYNTKHALDKLDGSIKLHSVLGEGSLFEVTIPGK